MPTIIRPEERINEPHGARIVILGPNGVGKTSLVRTLNPDETLFIDIENGGLSIADLPVDHLRLQTWQDVLDAAVRTAGPNPSFAAHETFSQGHFDRVGGWLPGIEKRQTVFFDTLTAASRLSFRWASQQPENFSDRTGKLDLRSAYGSHAREFIQMLHHLQSARTKNIILVGALDSSPDDYGRITHQLQSEGQRVPREIAGIVDIVLTMNWLTFEPDDKPIRAFVCTSPNPWGYPAKDRSGKLEQIEPPDLGRLLQKIRPSRANHAVVEGAPTPSPLQKQKELKT